MNAPAFTPCVGYPGYEVSADGRVRSVAYNWRGRGTRELAQTLNASGYPSVRLTLHRGLRTHIAVHRLVARTFIGECPAGCDQIRHLDGNPSNNCASNLAWGDARTNAIDRSNHGRAARITPTKRKAMREGLNRYWEARRHG